MHHNTFLQKYKWSATSLHQKNRDFILYCLLFALTLSPMKTNRISTRIIVASALCATVAAFVACTSKPKSNDIIAKKPVKTAPKPTQNMGDYNQNRSVEWLGGTYSISIERKADSSLPLAVDESGNKYYDNRVTLTISRSDGSEFFKHTFAKANFEEYVGDEYKNGGMLGIVFDHVDGDNIYFAASVGSPDKMSDNYVPLVLKISRVGGVTISTDTKLDTTSNDDDDEV